MSYARVNTLSDSDDDANSIPTSPSVHVRRTSSAAAASLASLTTPNSPRLHEYSQLSNNAIEGEEDSAQLNNEDSSVSVDQQARTDSENDIEIHVRFGEGQDLKLRVPREDTIAQVKEKSLFTHVEVPHSQHHHDFHDLQSRLSSSVEAVEAAANNILAGISSRTGGGDKATNDSQSTIRTQTSLGSILPTHIIYSANSDPSERNATHAVANSTLPHSLSSKDINDHIAIDMATGLPPLSNSKLNSRGNKHQSVHSAPTIRIPVQTGPIYFLCSLSDFPPAQPPSNVKKGKAVMTDSGSMASRSRHPLQSTSAAATAGRVGPASSPLTLPGRSHVVSNGEGSSSSSAGVIISGEHDRAEIEEEEETQGEEELSTTMDPQATGFDRLREAGFSEDEIQSIRRQFHASRGTVTSSVGENGIAVELDQDEDARARARRIEEEWIDQHGAETLPEGLEGSYGEMVWGLMLGFFMGLVSLFWFKEATFSRRQQMGIIAGLMINVGFGILHLYY
ncbi:hypothetical protein BGX27_008298 [Mortierella sp. AM989]|nr:hypothetical protein BGX27_008298 [Mortierella sp. AM989]